jgi:riboflavin kinase/FMN adenylyltransferase
MAKLPPEEFVRRILVARIGVKELVVGYDFSFGKNRSGDLALLQRLGQHFGFAVDAVPPVMVDGAPVSSTRIRDVLARGGMQEAAELLGRPYGFRGEVVQGDGRGRELGFPTANVQVDPDKLLPPDGVYAVHVRCSEVGQERTQMWNGLMNIGMRPSFGGRQRTVEVHLDGFAGNLYGQEMVVDILQRVREEKGFTNSRERVDQIMEDKRLAGKLWLSSNKGVEKNT